MNVLEEWLDSAVLVDIANDAGVSLEAARKVVGALAILPIRQAMRICHAAHQIEKRRGRRWS